MVAILQSTPGKSAYRQSGSQYLNGRKPRLPGVFNSDRSKCLFSFDARLVETEGKKEPAAEEAERLGHRHIGTEHVLLGLLGAEGSLAARLLQARGFNVVAVRERLSKTSLPLPADVIVKMRQDPRARLKLDSFLAGLKWCKAEELIDFFAQNAQFIDVFGKRWNREELFKGFEALFAPYAKRNAAPLVEETLADMSGLFVATVLWKNAILASMQRVWIHRMSVVLIGEGGDWRILLMHATAIEPSSNPK